MVALGQHNTAGECARQLLAALNSGSQERVHRALDGIATLTSASSADARESEFRDLLAGLVGPITGSVPRFLVAQNSVAKPVVLQMLAHVASNAA